jgi:RNA polymerase sporulation-specific sigma factor
MMKNNDYRDYCFKNTDKEECVEYLIQHNMGLVYNKVNSYFVNGSLNSDDLIQVGTIGLWKAIKTYDCNKPASFATYATTCINNEIRMLLRKHKRYNRLNCVSLSNILHEDSDGETLRVNDILYDFKSNEVFRNIEINELITENLCFSEIEKKIVALRLENKTQMEIAECLQCSQAYVSRVIKRCGNKLKEVLKG